MSQKNNTVTGDQAKPIIVDTYRYQSEYYHNRHPLTNHQRPTINRQGSTINRHPISVNREEQTINRQPFIGDPNVFWFSEMGSEWSATIREACWETIKEPIEEQEDLSQDKKGASTIVSALALLGIIALAVI
ncbi:MULTISPECIES: hypothetical protein [Moorena]|uniref:Uncharacterized protein n=1 Tax=Moorena producens 3L TaxID=489825 RepID=F4Y044_9CYAN|nr:MULTISPECIES: hypothetical protein [Moorena]NEQ16707.1 hypothetical protein [Moorena sp. SIO3E2]EGJ29776.1 hypothetical protein LYNGBM3L_59800 [Moorena producens 3L]NEP35927.1 hypothetical protein [Moorena sp. SIO3B2]NEP65703.1 hypothetical protein [Moorena sp. SIO3A5]NET64270.1 hypothetical protein [Moorena sp. SIO1G6]